MEQEEQVAVALCPLVVGEVAFLDICRIFHVTRHLFSLFKRLEPNAETRSSAAYLFQSHAVLDEQGYSRIEVSHILLQDEVLL